MQSGRADVVALPCHNASGSREHLTRLDLQTSATGHEQSSPDQGHCFLLTSLDKAQISEIGLQEVEMQFGPQFLAECNTLFQICRGAVDIAGDEIQSVKSVQRTYRDHLIAGSTAAGQHVFTQCAILATCATLRINRLCRGENIQRLAEQLDIASIAGDGNGALSVTQRPWYVVIKIS